MLCFHSAMLVQLFTVNQCLSQDLDFFQKKELLKFVRELFAKERSYPFHSENLANVYKMRVLYARTCRKHLEHYNSIKVIEHS